MSTTNPAPAILRNSIALSKAGDAPPTQPGVIEADTVAHCGPTAAGELREMFPFPLRVFDSDIGSEFINHAVADWLQERDIAQTRSRPYRKNDQATVESKNNHIVHKHAFYWRYDAPAELVLLNELWRLVSLRVNFFTPTRKPVGYAMTTDGRKKRLYNDPATPWQRVIASGQAMMASRGLDMASLRTSIQRLETTK